MESGGIHMIDVTQKEETKRQAVAECRVKLKAETLDLIRRRGIVLYLYVIRSCSLVLRLSSTFRGMVASSRLLPPPRALVEQGLKWRHWSPCP